MQAYTINQETLQTEYKDVARTLFHKELSQLNPYELNAVIAHVVKNKVIATNWEKINEYLLRTAHCYLLLHRVFDGSYRT